MPEDWRSHVRYGVLDLSGPYRAVFNQALDHVTRIADPFHLVRLANDKLDERRRRVQNETSAIADASTIRCIGSAGCWS